MIDGYDRDRLLNLVLLASVFTAQRKAEEACQTASAALRIARDVRPVRTHSWSGRSVPPPRTAADRSGGAHAQRGDESGRDSGSGSLTSLDSENVQQPDLGTGPDDLSPGNAIPDRVQADPLDPGCLVDVMRVSLAPSPRNTRFSKSALPTSG